MNLTSSVRFAIGRQSAHAKIHTSIVKTVRHFMSKNGANSAKGKRTVNNNNNNNILLVFKSAPLLTRKRKV
jgi:hypothetical protein